MFNHKFIVANQTDTQIPSVGDPNPNQDVPIRSYLDQTIVPLMLEGLAVISKERPERPIEFLADYLEKHNTER